MNHPQIDNVALAVDFAKRCERIGARYMAESILEGLPDHAVYRDTLLAIIAETMDELSKDLYDVAE